MKTLPDAHVDVWAFGLDTGQWPDSTLWTLLSPLEQERATRYRLAVDQKRFLRRRSLLKTLLGRYLNLPPARIPLSESPGLKPALPPGWPLHVSLSHRNGICLLAFARSPLGVDVEYIRPLTDLALVARQHFSPLEQHSFFALPPERQPRAFYHIWTQKEAYLKALGVGLTLPLACFDVQPNPEQPGGLLASRYPAPPGDWSLTTFAPCQGYVAALCHPNPAPVMRFFAEQPELILDGGSL